MITYRFNPEKIIEGLVWLATQAPNLEHYWIGKIIYAANRTHLNKYGRPVFGERIKALPYGPVPSFALDVVNGNITSPRLKVYVEQALDTVPGTTPKGKCLRAKRQPNEDLFSRTDIEELRLALEKYKTYSFEDLTEETHKDPAWKDAWGKRGELKAAPMDYALMVDDGPERDNFIAYMQETSQGAVF